MASSVNNMAVSEQYQHFIPRFILKSFSHPYKPPNRRNKAQKGQKPGKGYYRGDPMLYAFELSDSTIQIKELPVGRTFGNTDMYRDFYSKERQNHIEEKLSHLESRAAIIITKIRKAYEARSSHVWLPRSERDTLRKFLFIMKYRSSIFHKRFRHDNQENYDSNDREQLIAYMQEKGFQKPVDVWFDNLKTLLELHMDAGQQWMSDLLNRIYPPDAKWAITHMQSMYLAICTPDSAGDEFFLTDNGFSIHEGPNSIFYDSQGAEKAAVYTEYHALAVISPKLILVLRSFLLPNETEDANPEVREWRSTLHAASAIQHINPEASSYLEDLPITKPLNSYSHVVDGKHVLVDGEDGTPKPSHKFCFQFFPLSTELTNKINTIFLEQTRPSSIIALNTRNSFCRTLESYLSLPCTSSGDSKLKAVAATPDGSMLATLRKLEEAARSLGSDVTLVYDNGSLQSTEGEVSDAHLSYLGRILEGGMPKSTAPTIFRQRYESLGGELKMLPKDFDQAKKMWNMRIKIDVWSQGIDENRRQSFRDTLRGVFCQLPLRRVWLYLKFMRFCLENDGFSNALNLSSMTKDRLDDGPEDLLVDLRRHFRPNKFCRVMFIATENHARWARRARSRNAFGASGSVLSTDDIFGPAGSIRDCGIAVVEDRAQHYQTTLSSGELALEHCPAFWTREQKIEMSSRIMIQRDMSKLMNGGLATQDLKYLEATLFHNMYPIKT